MNRLNKKKMICFALLLMASALLAGCDPYNNSRKQSPIQGTALSGQEEQSVYAGLGEQLEALLAGPYAYTVRATSSHSSQVYLYQTEEYQVAFENIDPYYNGIGGSYLWYNDTLYWYDDSIPEGEKAKWNWREAGWEEMEDGYLEEVVDCGFTLLQEEPEKIEYREYPQGTTNPFYLKATYPLTNVALEPEQVHPGITVWLDQNGILKEICISWMRPNDSENGGIVEVTIWPYEESKDYEAELKIWRVGYDLGICDTRAPEVTKFYTDRDWCEEIMQGMDFTKLQTPDRQYDELQFYSPYILLAR